MLSTCAKAHHQFRWMLSNSYIKNGKQPFRDYMFITPQIWETFVQERTSKEAKSKDEMFSTLVKKNMYHHDLGATGYTTKKKIWWEEERAAAEAGLPIEYESLNERTSVYLKARKPKWLQEGWMKFNETQTEQVEARILAVAVAKQSEMFNPCKERD